MTQVEASERIKGKDGASMVLIPAGEFLMGTTDNDDMGYRTEFRKEKPQHVVYLDAFQASGRIPISMHPISLSSV